MRGQAFIVFEELSSAMQAVKEMQNFNFYQKQMVKTKIYIYNFIFSPRGLILQKKNQILLRRKKAPLSHERNKRISRNL